MKHLKSFLIIVCVLLSANLLAQNSAPSMHLVANFSSDVVLKMQKVKILQSAQASFFEVNNFNGGYCGLQQVTASPTGSTNTFIASLWDTNTAAGIYAKTEYHDPSTVASRFGGEGDGAKTMNPYGWDKHIWYNVVNRAWKSNGRYFVATYIQDLSSGKWFHTSTLSRTFDGYLGNFNDAFMENWIGSNSGQYVRKAFFKDCFGMNGAGQWLKGTNTRFSANDGEADVSRNGIYHNSFNAYYDADEDAFCMQHGGNTVRDEAFNNGRTRNLGNQLKQAAQPTLATGEITELSATHHSELTTINWKVDETKSPQLSARIDIVDASNKLVLRSQDTIPHQRSFSYQSKLTPGTYTVKIMVRDIFNKLYPTATTTLEVLDTPYLTLSDTSFLFQAETNTPKKLEIISNINWSISSNQDWLTTNITSGKGNATVLIKVAQSSKDSIDQSGILTIEGKSGPGYTTRKRVVVLKRAPSTWYYVFNQRSWSAGEALFINALTGTPLGVELTARAPMNNNYAQQWRILNKGGNDVQLTNRLTGLAIDADCKASDPAEPYYWQLKSYSGAKAFPGSRIISKDGKVGIHASGTRVFPYNHEVAECFWVFITSEELFEQPKTPIQYSSEAKEYWYNIYTPGRKNRNYLTDKGLNAYVEGENLQSDNAGQQWKIIDLEDGTFNIISRLNKGQIEVPYAHLTNMLLTDTDQAWTLDYQGQEQYHITNSEFQLHMSSSSTVIASNGTSLGDASSWIFEKTPITAVSNLTSSDINVYAVNGKIIVVGSDEKPKVYTFSGQELDGTQVLSSGAYIVKVADRQFKIII